MDRSTLSGLLIGFGLISLAILSQGNFIAFISIASLLIVMGGVFAATLVNYNYKDIVDSYYSLKHALTTDKSSMTEHVEMMIMFARRARRNGLLVLDDDVGYVEDEYLRNGLELAVDGISEENLRQILDDEIASLEKRQEKGVKVLESMGGYSPAFGMIGTIIGLVLMLQNLEDPQTLGAGLSIALITTFYGTTFANLVFTPLAGKLQQRTEEVVNEKSMLRSGIMSLANGENPRIMEKKMLSFVNPEDRAEYLRIHGTKGYTQQQEEKLYNHWVNQQKDKWENVLSNLETG